MTLLIVHEGEGEVETKAAIVYGNAKVDLLPELGSDPTAFWVWEKYMTTPYDNLFSFCHFDNVTFTVFPYFVHALTRAGEFNNSSLIGIVTSHHTKIGDRGSFSQAVIKLLP